ncbi:MAG: ketoacyl-ACP synthase III [Alphaproteobacteria bacterium]|jgi:3-oxoacyl-[acyl-carrier-protein] synthase III|nr:ketoacyl-ACP synthase III [Alphaproteobacteria bacterium]MBT5389230.1 ketoacyl-ACP synthase III [Alphaproteobacteria bacterium]
MTIRAIITGCGNYLPEKVLTNDDLAQMVDTSDEWITQRVGIRSRHIAAEGECTSDMGAAAATKALQAANIKPTEVDFLICATTTPDKTFPATGTQIQHKIGMAQGFAFDVQAVCSGFVYALAVANNFIQQGQGKTALVVGAETFSRIVDWNDRGTCVLFGDGAGAVVLQAEKGAGTVKDRGILSTHLYSDGRHSDILCTDGGASTTKTTGVVQMQGREVFRHATEKMAEVVEETLKEHNLGPEALDWFVPHQANSRIIQATAKRANFPMDKVIMTVERHGNTSAASIPLALAEAVDEGKIKQNQLVLLDALGGGLTWGSALIRW